jgi:CheY-like chemotaxis protein
MMYPTIVNQNQTPKASILVIEDNPDQWFIIRWALLRCFPEIEPIWMADSTEAIQYLETCLQNEKKLPKLILLDLYLPNRAAGWNLLQIIKTHHLYREMPVVILSSSSDPEDIKESYMFRSNSYIVKPNSYEKWLECFSLLRHYWWEAVTLPEPV